jgi:hypothetical protein
VFEKAFATLLLALVVFAPPLVALAAPMDRRWFAALGIVAAVISSFTWSYVSTERCGPL